MIYPEEGAVLFETGPFIPTSIYLAKQALAQCGLKQVKPSSLSDCKGSLGD